MNYILAQEPVQKVPKHVTQEAVFVIDLNGPHGLKDSLADENGSFRMYSHKQYRYIIENLCDPSSRSFKLVAKENASNVFEFRKFYSKLKADGRFKRKVVTVASLSDNKLIHKALIGYYWDDEDEATHFFPTPVHGNSTVTNKPFYTTEKSTLMKVNLEQNFLNNK